MPRVRKVASTRMNRAKKKTVDLRVQSVIATEKIKNPYFEEQGRVSTWQENTIFGRNSSQWMIDTNNMKPMPWFSSALSG